MFIINIYIYIVIEQYVVEKIKNNLRNPQAENDPKFKKRAGWPKNLVSYKKKHVYMCIYFLKTHEDPN